MPPSAVADQVRRLIPNHVLVAQVDRNLLCNIRKVPGMFGGKHAPARNLRQTRKQRRSGALSGKPSESRPKNPDAKNLHIGLLNRAPDILFSVSAVVVAAVGYNQQCLALQMGFLHFMESE